MPNLAAVPPVVQAWIGPHPGDRPKTPSDGEAPADAGAVDAEGRGEAAVAAAFRDGGVLAALRDEDGYLLYNRVDDPWEQTNVYADHIDRAAALEAILEEHIARNPGTRSGRTNVEIDEDLLERLKAAGYVGGNEDEEDE